MMPSEDEVDAMRNFLNWVLIAFLWILAILVLIMCFG